MSVIASTNRTATANAMLKVTKVPTNSATMTRQTASAPDTQKRMAQLMSAMRRHNTVVSRRSNVRCSSRFASGMRRSMTRARSTMRASRVDSTPSRPAMPASRNTGATASSMTSATATIEFMISSRYGYGSSSMAASTCLH
jgi:hypothetical protein